jgi:hypothetical protein
MRELPFISRSMIFFQLLAAFIFLNFSYRDAFGVALKLHHKKRSFRVIKERQNAGPSQERALRQAETKRKI